MMWEFIINVREAFANLVSAKLRSFLAILGVLVGTGSVVALISSSQLATAHALAQFKTLGTNLLAMSVQDAPGASNSGGKGLQLRLGDMPKLITASKQIVAAAPYTNVFAPIIFNGKTYQGQTLGATEALRSIAKIGVARGRFVSYLDKYNYYCVIGSKLAAKIKATGVDPMYKELQLGTRIFTIVGIARPWEPNLFIFADINDGVIIPIETSYIVSPQAQIDDVIFRLVKNPNLTVAQNDVKTVLKEILPNKQAQFRNPEQIIKIVAKQRSTFTWLLGAIGGISLIVGGIGVMNIMLVSVVERRREIGIRMAIGARRSDILKMFLIESVILTLFGGTIGIVTGVLSSFVLAELTKWQFQLYLLPPLLGFVVSFLVGILSGYYPALRASKLDPIQTLQSE